MMWRSVRFVLAWIGCFGLTTAPGLAQTAANDLFENRVTLRGSDISVTASSLRASKEAREPNHAGNPGGASLWWLWRPPEEGFAVVTTEDSSFDTLLGIYFGKDLGSLSVVTFNDDNTNSLASRVSFDAEPQRDYVIAVDGKAGASGAVSLKIHLYTKPEILVPPAGQEVAEGENATFNFQAIGKRPLSYQWRRFGTNLPGETGATLTVQVATKALAGSYSVVVGNSYGAITSAPPAILRVVERPKIAQHPKSLDRLDGETAIFTVRAFGEEPLQYQWEYKATGTGDYLAVPGADAATLQLDNLSTDEIGFYRARVSNAFGEAISDGARLQVTADRPRILEPLTNRTVVEVTNVLFTAKVAGHRPLQYQWFRGNAAIPGANDPEYLIDPARTTASGEYKFQVWNRYGTNTSQTSVLTVEPRPPNDYYTNRIDISFETNVVFGFNKNGTAEAGEKPLVGQLPRHTVWWSYQATNRGVITLDFEKSALDTVVAVYRGVDLATLEKVAENDNFIDPRTGGSRVQSYLKFVVEPGFEYSIVVDGKNGAEADWKGNGGKGSLAFQVNFNPEFGAPFFLGELDGFFLLLGEFFGDDPGGGGCGDASFTLKADGLLPVGYQWQYNLRCLTRPEILNDTGSSLVPDVLPNLLSKSNWFSLACTSADTWINIPGATNDTLVLHNLTVEHTGQYRLVAANVGAGGAITSAPTRIVVSPLPKVISNLPSAVEARECDRRELYFEVDGGCYPVSYEWYFNGQRLASLTTNRLVFTNGIPAQSGSYYAVGRGPYGGTTSVVSRVTFDATPIIKTPPRSLGAPAKDCEELALFVEVQPACSEILFQWLLNGNAIAGATNRTLSFRATAETAGEYRVRLYNRYATNTSQIANVPVDSNPFITEHPEWAKPKRFLVGAAFTNFVAVQSCSELTFEWRLNGKPLALDANHIMEQRLADPGRSILQCSLAVRNAGLSDAGRYDVVVKSRGGTVTSRGGDVEIYFRPPNDDFINRIALPSTNLVITATNFYLSATVGTNILASAELNEPEHARQSPSRSIWWTWTSPVPSMVTVDTIGSDFDTLLSVYTGAELASLKRLSDDDQSGGNNTSKAAFLAARGRVVHFAVDGSRGAEGRVQLHLKAEEIVSPPIILKQPSSLAATNGATAIFSVDSYGSPDILYQWLFNGSPLAGATNASLTLTNVQEFHEGNYTVNLRNEYGSTNSFIARLTFGIIIEGQVTDATNRRGVPGAKVSVGDISTITDTNGNYILIGVRPGKGKALFDAVKRVVRIKEVVQFNNQTTLATLHLHAEKQPEYIDYDDYQFTARLGQAVTNKFSMSPVFDGIRFVVNWGLDPADLDAHLLTPPFSGDAFHVWYPETSRGNRTNPPFAFLDQDVRDSYGPETLTIHRLENGVYRFYIKKFDPGAKVPLSGSKAIVKLYTRNSQLGPDGLYASREVPAVGDGAVWHVCDIDGTRNALTWADAILAADPPAPEQPATFAAPTRPANRAFASATAPPRYPGVRFEWDFGDGGTSSEIDPRHAYKAPGCYAVRLSVFSSGSGELLDSEYKTNFICVYNEAPVVQIANPPSGRLFKFGADISIEVTAQDIDGEIRSVDLLAVADGRTNRLTTFTAEPYRFNWPKPAPGSYTLTATARDDFDGVGISRPVKVRVLDLDGEILLIQNFADPEIDAMADFLRELKIPDGPFSARQAEVRILDQEGLYFDLIKHFKLIIWNDQGSVTNGLADADVELLSEAQAAGIPLYLIGTKLGSSAYNLSASYDAWQKLTHLVYDNRVVPPAALEFVDPDRRKHEFFRQVYGLVEPFPIENEIEICTLSGADEVSSAINLGTTPLMLRHPPFGMPDFGGARTVTQNFRIITGGELDPAPRRALFLNTAAWLLRLTDCTSFGASISCEEPLSVRLGEPVTLTTRVVQNGECTLGGVLLTNLLSPKLQLASFEIEPAGTLADTNTVRLDVQTNQVVARFSRLRSAGSFEAKLTVIPRKGGYITNLLSLTFGAYPAEECRQILRVEGADCDQPVLLSVIAQPGGACSLSWKTGPGCEFELQSSSDLKNWAPESAVTAAAEETTFTAKSVNSRRFYRIRSQP